MVDPLSVVASVIGVATAALQSSKTLSILINDIREASEEIDLVSRDVLAFASVVSSLKLMLGETKIQDAVSGDNTMIEVIGNLRHPLDNCETALQNLSSKLSNQLEYRNSRTFRATGVRLRWALFAKKEAKDLQSRLGFTKATLSAALNAITTLHTTRTLGAIRNAPWRDLSYNFNSAIENSLQECDHEITGPASSSERAIVLHQTIPSPEAVRENAQTPVLSHDEHEHETSLDRPLDPRLARIFLQLKTHSNQIRQLNSVLQQSQKREDRASTLLLEDDIESSLDMFFDCVSNFSDSDSIEILQDCETRPIGSPNSYFESSALFCPEQYSLDRLFDERIFVSAMVQSREDERTLKYFIDFAYEPRKWRGVVVLAIPRIEQTQPLLPYSIIHIGFGMRKKLPEAFHESLSKLLPTLDLFDSVTKITLPFSQDNSGELIVDLDGIEMAEDTTEIALYCEDPIMLDIEDLDCAQFLESEVVTQYHMSSPYFVVWIEGQSCIERKAPFRSARPGDSNALQEFCDDLKLESSLRGCPGVIHFIGVVLDDTRRYLKSYVHESFSSNIEAMFESAACQGETIPWHIRETWAWQIVTAVAEVHKRGIAPVLVSSYTISIRPDGSAVILPRSPRPSDGLNGHLAPELRESSHKKGPRDISKFRTDIFRLGLILWQLAEHQDNLSNFFCSQSGCTTSPRCACNAPHRNPVELPNNSTHVPLYFRTMIQQCRARDPKARPSAHQLLDSFFPPETVGSTQEPTAQAILQKFPPLEYSAVYCDECGARIMKTYYPFNVCGSGGVDFCLGSRGESTSAWQNAS